MLLYYSKPFHTIDCRLLQPKISFYGVDSALSLSSSYLSDRSQMVKINLNLSHELEVFGDLFKVFWT